jgi:AcrR family transcriptional regulator
MGSETRQKILDAAEKLILTRGLARITIKEIAREVGLSDGALYRHFSHKEEIFMALVHKYRPALIDAFQMHLAGTATVGKNLTALAMALLHYYGQMLPMSATFLADTELLARYREAIEPINAGPQNVFKEVAAYIEEEQHLGRLGQHIPALNTATQLLGPCFQRVFMVHLLGYDPFHKTDQQFAEELVQGLMVSILPS